MNYDGIDKISTVYVAAIHAEGFPGETIFVGTHKDEHGNQQPRATVEHHDWAIGSLVEMADAVVEAFSLQGKKASYRLLQFTNPIELDVDFYRGTLPFSYRCSFK